MRNSRTIFDRCGLAALSDLEAPEWKSLFAALEREAAVFQEHEPRFRSKEYVWPRDPLHNWSRMWEYPYVFHHLKCFSDENAANGILRSADVGSGVTFFPFALARLGFHVTCADIDPICERDMSKAVQCVPQEPGKVDFRMIHGDSLPFEDGEIDVVYCISVLEHISTFEKTVSEIGRILKKGGLFLLTIDLDLRGNAEIGRIRHRDLIECLNRLFIQVYPDRTIHPADLLCSAATQIGYPLLTGHSLAWFAFKHYVLKAIIGRKPGPVRSFDLAIQGLVLEPRCP